MKGLVFIVDDNPNNLGVLANLIRDDGYEVRLATSGRRALAAIPKTRPDVVLLDVNMPDLDGIEVCRALQADPTTAQIPVIFLSALDETEWKVRGFELGGVDYIAKPFEAREVLARVGRQVTLSRMRLALEESESRLRAVTETAADAILSADADGRIIGWNRAATETFGWEPSEAIGQSLELVIPRRFHKGHRVGMARVLGGGEQRVVGRTVELSANHRDGHELPVELSLSMWTVGGRAHFTGILRDISVRKEAEDALRRYADELALKNEELEQQHAALLRSREALLASYKRAERLFAAATRSLEGSVLDGRYRVDEQIGTGGFGVVCRGWQMTLGRSVAIKLFRMPDERQADSFYERFAREGAAACRVQHKGAIEIYDAGITEGGLPWLVMELLEGRTLAEYLQEVGVPTVVRGLGLIADVCDVLQAAHDAGIVHRDIKPANIYLHGPDPETAVAKVLDFGIASLQDDAYDAAATRTGQLLGTPDYMAPERLAGDPSGGAMDVYAVGVTLYEVLIGKRPFGPSGNVWTTVWMHQNATATPLSDLVPEVPPELDALAGRLLAKSPGDRPTPGEAAAELRAIVAGIDPTLRYTGARVEHSETVDVNAGTTEPID